MLPQKSDERWKHLVTGQIEHDFKAISAGLMVSMIKRYVARDLSADSISIGVNKIFDFFQRHEEILQEDIHNIFYGGQDKSSDVTELVYTGSKNVLASVNEIIPMITSGRKLFLAGDERALSALPKGNWIGGTTPYFMSEKGGAFAKDKIFVTDIPDCTQDVTIKFYAANEIEMILQDRPDHGFSFIIIPAKSEAHITYAQQAPNRSNLFMKPIIGWISGVHLNDLGRITPKVFDGLTGKKTDEKAVVMHLALPSEKIAVIGIINIFRQGMGDSIQFEKSGFNTKDCMINGVKTNFAEYLRSNGIDTRLPMVANYNGAMVNISFQEINEQDKTVSFYAPVFRNVKYKLAQPINNYIEEFITHIPDKQKSPFFACNCILNYIYSELESKKTGAITGPVTFGEIAYQLLNQTLTYIDIKELK